MLLSWIFDRQRIFKQLQWLKKCEYCTDAAAIRSVLRSEANCTNEIATKILTKNEFLLRIDPNEMKKSIQLLKRLNFLICDIKAYPRILLQSDDKLLNNFQRLHEVGFTKVTPYRLANITGIMKKSVHFNQAFNFLPKLDVYKNTYAVAKIPFNADDCTSCSQEMRLGSVHQLALRNYMLNRIEYTQPEIDEIWFNYPSMKQRSLQSIHESAQLIEEMLGKPVKQLPKFILTMQPEDIKEMRNVKSVCGVDVVNILTLGPRYNLARLKEIQQIFWMYEVPDYVVVNAHHLFKLSVDTLTERLDRLYGMARGKEYLRHISVGRLIMNMNRMEIYAKSQGKTFQSIFDEKFFGYFLDQYVYTKKCNAAITYLCCEFNKTEQEIRDALRSHPKGSDYKFRAVQVNIEFLLSRGFTREDIFKDMHIILYPLIDIEQFFNSLKDLEEWKTLNLNIDPTKLSHSQILRICVYLIEKKHGFKGDGIYENSPVNEFEDDYCSKMEEIMKKIKM